MTVEKRVPRNFYIRPSLHQRLQRESRRTGIPIAQLVERALNDLLDGPPKPRPKGRDGQETREEVSRE